LYPAPWAVNEPLLKYATSFLDGCLEVDKIGLD